MRIFLTGATGYVGRALLSAFRRGGHSVVALVRSPAKADAIANSDVTPVVGDLSRPDDYVTAAAECDAVVHAAFEYGPDGDESCAVDELAVEALLLSARSRGRPFVYTSNAYLLRTAGGDPVDETVDPRSVGAESGAWRFALERTILSTPTPAAVVRLGLVYGGVGGTVSELFAAAHRGRLGYVGNGQARASTIYHHDLAALYLLVLERRATGLFHATDGQPLPAVELVGAVNQAAGRGGEVTPLDPDRHALTPHTLDTLDRDVAVLPRRSFGLDWRPRFRNFRDGAATAFAEWRLSHATS
jgi:nucleoside-diphosphate-sugar epimerase